MIEFGTSSLFCNGIILMHVRVKPIQTLLTETSTISILVLNPTFLHWK